MYKLLLLTIGVLTGVTSNSWSQIYGYKNEKGILVISNVPSSSKMKLLRIDPSTKTSAQWQDAGEYDTLIINASTLTGVDPELIKAVIAVESGFNRQAVSAKGALGLMQLIPATARRYGVVNPFNPWQNIKAGATYLCEQLQEFGDLKLALAAYNAGPSSVKRYNGIPPYQETISYVNKVLSLYPTTGTLSIVQKENVYTINSPAGTISIKRRGGSKLSSSNPIPQQQDDH